MSANLPFSKSIALDAYRWATTPLRATLAAWQAREHKVRVMLLFYHRVARGEPNGWTITPERFREQMEFVRERYDLVSLAECQRRLRDGNEKPCVHVTFDDGYAENCDEAIPLLISWRIPTTYFVASGHVLNSKSFEHDVKLGKPLPVNTPSQIKAMAEAGIEIGAHTRTHIDLSMVDDEAIVRDEIIGSKHDLEAMTGRPVRYFAFPFGRPDTLTSLAISVAREAGFEAICSAYGGYNLPKQDGFHLQRIHGDPPMARFKNWLTLDPRKLDIYHPLSLDESSPTTSTLANL